jgi:hypothetical protein
VQATRSLATVRPNVCVSPSTPRVGEFMRRLREAGYADVKGELCSHVPPRYLAAVSALPKASLQEMACATLTKIGTISSMSSKSSRIKFQQWFATLFSSIASMGHDNHAAHREPFRFSLGCPCSRYAGGRYFMRMGVRNLRQACLHKEELGEEGMGNCQRFRRMCRH